MSAVEAIRLVFAREVGDRLRNRAFVITTLISLLVIVGIIVVPGLFADDEPEQWRVGVLATADLPASFEASLAAVAESADATVDLSEVPDRARADDDIRTGDLDAVVVDDTTVVADDIDSGLRNAIQLALTSSTVSDLLTEAGVNPDEVFALFESEVVVVNPDGADDEATTEATYGAGVIVTILLFLTLQINGASLLTTTVEEKSSRVVEVMLSTLRPWHLLAGKLVAMTVLSVGQLLLYAGTALAAIQLTGDVTVPPASPMIVVTGVVMFLLGFALWGSVFAVAGALATSAEEAQSSAGPIGFASAAVYLAVLAGVVPNPDGTLALVLSFIPFSAPFAIPARAAAGLPVWQFVVAAILTGIGTALGVRLAGRLYSAAVLAGGKMTWRDAFRAEPIR